MKKILTAAVVFGLAASTFGTVAAYAQADTTALVTGIVDACGIPVVVSTECYDAVLALAGESDGDGVVPDAQAATLIADAGVTASAAEAQALIDAARAAPRAIGGAPAGGGGTVDAGVGGGITNLEGGANTGGRAVPPPNASVGRT